MTRALIFDSGVGGLSVVADIRRRLPDLSLDYVADDAFRPYGDKTPAQLRARLPGLLATLTDMLAPDLVVIACNTASTTALEPIRAALSVPVVGVVPAVKPAASTTRTGAIAVLGTPATVQQDYVESLISDFAGHADVHLLGSTILVAMAEAKLEARPVDIPTLTSEIAPLFDTDIDTIVLACTHFPLLRKELATAAPRPVIWIDSGDAIARRVQSLLLGITPDSRPDTAFLIGPAPSPARARAFRDYGFTRVIPLE